VAQVEAVDLNNEEMFLIIKRFKTALKWRKDYNNNKSKGKHTCFKCDKTSHFIANYPNYNDDQDMDKIGKKVKKDKFYK
jgi:hypothetical protein